MAHAEPAEIELDQAASATDSCLSQLAGSYPSAPCHNATLPVALDLLSGLQPNPNRVKNYPQFHPLLTSNCFGFALVRYKIAEKAEYYY